VIRLSDFSRASGEAFTRAREPGEPDSAPEEMD